MKALVKELLHLTEVRQLTEDVRGGVSPVLVTGVGPVHRAQVEAALHRDSGRPLWVLCADEREARRQAGDLAVLTGETPLVLPARELQWRPMESSRQWENQRLAALYRLADSPVVVTTPDALVQRCIPPRVLERTALTLAVGQQWDLNALTRRLAGAGYTRCDQVEGPGQFALRGGILDVFSPGMEQPVRCEFFDDEIDSLGIFDAATQRRVENRREALLLPAAEVLPGWEEHTAEDAAARLEAAVKRLARRQGTQALQGLLTADAGLLRQGVTPNGADRCMAAVYPEKTTALDYLPADALICVEDSGRTAEALRGWLWQLKEDVSAGMEAGFLVGELADFAASEPELALGLEKHPVVQLDSLTTGRQLLQPRDLLQLTAKQLSSYGGSLELACTDLTHYLTSGYRVMVLCGGEVRARNLRRMLADRKIPAAVDLSGEKSPEKGTVLIAVGALSAGCEYPEGRLAVLTEGQLTTPLSGRAKKPRPRRDSNQQKLQSYTDLTPGDLVVHAHHGIGRFVAMLRMPVDGVEKDYIKIAYAGQDVLYVPATSLDLVSKYIGPGEDNERTKLNKLGGTEWAKTTRKAKAAAKDLATSAHIPERYVPSAHQRMDLYRRMAAIRTTEEASDLVDELTDRYGDPPKPVMALLDVALLRAAAADVFITDITQRAGVVAFTFDSRVDVPSLMAVSSMPGYRNRLRLSAGEPPRLRLHLAPGEDALSAAGKLTEELRLKKEELGKAAREGDNL